MFKSNSWATMPPTIKKGFKGLSDNVKASPEKKSKSKFKIPGHVPDDYRSVV